VINICIQYNSVICSIVSFETTVYKRFWCYVSWSLATVIIDYSFDGNFLAVYNI